MQINLEELSEFLIKAKINTYASDAAEISPQRPNFKELEFSKGDWNYRDSYAGSIVFPGQEVVRFKTKPVWIMSYHGEIFQEYWNNPEFIEQTFDFLKLCLRQVIVDRPFRGPKNFQKDSFEYFGNSRGSVSGFMGEVLITFKDRPVYELRYFGGLVHPNKL